MQTHQDHRLTFLRLLHSLLIGCFVTALCLLPACSVFPGANREMIDPSLAMREYLADSGELRLFLETELAELPSTVRPVALFIIPDAALTVIGAPNVALREAIDSKSELAQRLLKAALPELQDSDHTPCRLERDGSLTGCTLMAGYMLAIIGTCTRYPMAYQAWLTLPVTATVEAQVMTAIAIIDQDSQGKIKQMQIIAP